MKSTALKHIFDQTQSFMRQQIAAANWKMNLTYEQGQELLDTILNENIALPEHQRAVFAVPFPYLVMAHQKLAAKKNYFAAAQNCSDKKSGAYTGEVSAEMLRSIDVKYCVIGHSERREYFGEHNHTLARKVEICLVKRDHPNLLLRRTVEHPGSWGTKRFCRDTAAGGAFSFQREAAAADRHRL